MTQGNKCAALNTSEGSLFYRLWSRRGDWLSVTELLVNLQGEPVPSEDPVRLVKVYMSYIRKKLRAAEIDLVIENQRQSFWAESKYRLKATNDA